MRFGVKTPPSSFSAVVPPVPSNNNRSNSNSSRGGGRGRKGLPSGPNVKWCPKLQHIFVILFGIWVIYMLGVVIMAIQVHKMDPSNNGLSSPSGAIAAADSHQHGQGSDRRAAEVSPHHVIQLGKQHRQEKTALNVNGNNDLSTIFSPAELQEMKNLKDSIHKEAIQDHVEHRAQHEQQQNKQVTQSRDAKIVKGEMKQQIQKSEPSEVLQDPVQQGFIGGSKMTRGMDLSDMIDNKDATDPAKRKPKKKRPGFKANPYGHMVDPQKIDIPAGVAANLKEKKSQAASSATTSDKNKAPERNEILRAFLEPINPFYWDSQKTHPKPLPLRNFTKDNLKQVEFKQLNSCKKLPSQWPVDNFPDDDPFLPWIHDVFPSLDGQQIQFIAQNKLRCKTGTTIEEEALLRHMAPQVALFQHVAVKRVSDASSSGAPRYRLSTHEDADQDGIATRFICRFKDTKTGTVQETLSVYNNDYEWTSVRKRHRKMFQRDGRDNQLIHASQLIFSCPTPANLVQQIKDGSSVVDDWATIFIDLVPIRTPPRYTPPSSFLQPRYWKTLPKLDKKNLELDTGKDSGDWNYDVGLFNATHEWGDKHILPLVEDAGRWENVPVCRTSLQEYEPTAIDSLENTGNTHHLVSCLWASSGYTTRGNRFAINDGQRRLLEWMTYNQMLGFDHFYIYDNSGAFSNETSLQPIADLFDETVVTVIPWPSRICNNNPNNVGKCFVDCGSRNLLWCSELQAYLTTFVNHLLGRFHRRTKYPVCCRIVMQATLW